MTLETKILGTPGRDNALYVEINTGQQIHRILLDCGEVSLFRLGKAVIQDIDILLLSHAHMDHISGFDSIFRHVYSRYQPFHIFGPRGITAVIHHRLQGYTWNLIKGKPGEVQVHEVHDQTVRHSRFFCKEGFSRIHRLPETKRKDYILEHEDYQINTAILDHRIDCLAYAIEEKSRQNINPQAMENLGLQPGPWCRHLKLAESKSETKIETNQGEFSLLELRDKLLDTTAGEKVTYVTDIIMNPGNHSRLTELAKKSNELVIECTYNAQDEGLAKKNYHLTVKDATTIARDSQVEQCTLFHVSDRYNLEERRAMLIDARKIHTNSVYPSHWNG